MILEIVENSADSIVTGGGFAGIAAAVVWIGKQLLKQNERYIERLDRVLDAMQQATNVMDEARERFESERRTVKDLAARAAGKAAPLVLLLAMTLAIVSCASAPTAWIAADRATFNAIAPEFRRYVGEDTDLSDEQKILRTNTLETWRIRLETYERGNTQK